MTVTVDTTKALTSLVALKRWLEIDENKVTAKDDLYRDLINKYSDVIADYLERKIVQTTYTNEDYNGTGTPSLFLNNYPIISVTSVYEDSGRDFGAGTLLTEDTDYIVEKPEGVLRKQTGYSLYAGATKWPKGIKAIRVTYVAGYATIPSPLEQACNMIISRVLTSASKTGLVSQSLDGHSVSYRAWRKDPEILELLNAYKSTRYIGGWE